MSDRDLTRDLLNRLRRHYIKPGQPYSGGVLIEECGWNGGANLSRCDALYVGFTGTSGRRLIGHEVKVSRADWRKELDTPGKADAWADQCHAWYVVAPSTAIVPPNEVPDGWGLLIPNPRTTTRMDVVVKATVHEQRQPSWTAVRSLIARMDTLQHQALLSLEARVKREANEWAVKQAEAIAADLDSRRHPDRAKQLVSAFEETLGRRLVDDSRHYLTRDDEICPSDLQVLLPLLQPARDLQQAVHDLTRRYNGRTDAIRGACDRLDQALAAITAAAAPDEVTS